MENEFREEIEALEALKSYNVKMVKALKEIIPELKGQKKEDTDEYFQHILKGLNWEIQVLNGTMNYLNRNEIIIDKEKLNRSISELNSAVQDNNSKMIGNVVEQCIYPFLIELNNIIDNDKLWVTDNCKKSPKVSIVMPCYNHAEYVAEAIQSVLNQTYNDFEFLIVDNGSDDDSYEIISNFNDPRIKFFRLEKNDIPKAYDIMLSNAVGEYIAMMFSDDIWYAEKLESQMEALTKNKDVLVSVTWADVMSDGLNIIESSNIFKKRNRSRLEWIRFLLENGNCLSICSAVARQDIFRKYLVKQAGYWQLPDYYAWLLVLQETNIYIVERNLVKIRFHGKEQNQNISYPSVVNTLRTMTERKIIVYQIIDNMRDDDFVHMYKDQLIYPKVKNHLEILCEKLFVFIKYAQMDKIFQDNVFYFYYKYFSYEEAGITMGEVLQSKYNFLQVDFSKISGSSGSVVELFQKNEHEITPLKKLRSLISDVVRNEIRNIKDKLNEISICLNNDDFSVFEEFILCMEKMEKNWDILSYMEIGIKKDEIVLCKKLCCEYMKKEETIDRTLLIECAITFRNGINELLV